MNICVITYKYPGKHNTSDYAFVKQLVDAIAEQGHHCYVIAPFNISHYRRLSVSVEKYEVDEGDVTVYRPGYLSFSNFHVGHFYPSTWQHDRAIKKAFRMMGRKPDAIYGHFWKSGYIGYRYAKEFNIPLFVATGESEIATMFSPKPDVKEFAQYVSGVICVSSKNRDESVSLGLTTYDKCCVLPNSINTSLFTKRDKAECRAHLGLPQNVFIVAFVGWFIERKGPRRVAEAIKKIPGNDVYSLFIGKGEQMPECDNILFKGPLQHEEIPLYLNAADAFVLPTLSEGCCNAVVEAMACGLPIISSNLPFNWDILDASNSIMIDPKNIDAISTAIRTLRDDRELLHKLSDGALKMVESLTVDKRAKNIIDFMGRRSYNYKIDK